MVTTATITSTHEPYYIKSNAIAVFPCANRTNKYASRFTTEYNLTHLGLPNTSWISNAVSAQNTDRTTGISVEKNDKISCVINGYFFEFSLKDAFAINGDTLTPLIPQNASSTTNTLTAYIATKGSTSSQDPLEKQAQLCAIVPQNDDQQNDDQQYAALDANTLFLGLAIFVGDEEPQISDAATYSLQLASSGKYPYIGVMPPMPNNSITAAKLGNVISQESDTANGIQVNLSQASSSGGGLKIEVISDKVDEASLAYNLWHEGINSTERALNTNVSATTKKPLGVKLSGGAGSGNGTTVAVQLTGGVATSNIYNRAITASKLGSDVVDSTVSKLGPTSTLGVKLTGGNGTPIKAELSGSVDTVDNAGTADVAKQIMIGSTAYTLSFSGNVLTFSS